ncbi:hypothetical protein [Burkholderia cepacia]|uniref:hypothetical protein n=1 Tax=Burkholderia cepacia TaxID=292 RepID=UPI000AC9498E|nr:hypothetical protein [Burkholderia cepacia]
MRIEDSQRLNFFQVLLDPEDSFQEGDFASCLNARGMYESRRFALRLNPRIHSLVDTVVEKSAEGETKFSGEEIQAYSTYLHETIHWWQHKGSTSGFVRSMLPPLQTHVNLNDLRSILESVGPQKSIKTLGLQGELGLLSAGSSVGPLANTVTNNFMDTEFFLALTLNPKKFDLQIYEDNYFECAGHSFLVTYDHVLGFLRTIFDEQGLAIPDPKPIEANLENMKARKVTGYYWGSPIIRAPLGLHQLYEGQARFNQLQFITFAGCGLTFAQARADGLLDDVYGEAFQAFLDITGSTEPASIADPLVALFLLVCDLSINPTAGFPLPIEDYEDFVLDADPGIRFAILCRTIADDLPELRAEIVDYTADEYWTVAERLCQAAGFESYLKALGTLGTWKSIQPQIAQLLDEHHDFVFSRDNIVPRVLFSEFLKFNEDKLRRPEFFCWAGYWLTHATGSAELDLWMYHLSLFSDQEHDGRLFARKTRNHDESKVLEVFNQFFAAVVLYDLTRQWVLQNGPFTSDYSWLILPHQEEEFNEKISALFQKHYGARLEAFILLQPPARPRV